MNPRSITSEEPGISVSAPATRPPVQDSAVAMVSLRIRHRSSSERDKARASLPLMSFAPGKTNGGARGGGDALFAAGEAEPFAGGRFHGNARNVYAADLGDFRAHRIAQRADLWPLADQRHLEIADAPAACGNALNGVFQKAVGGGALPLRIARREMRADITVGERAEDRIDQRMQAHIAVGMGEKTLAVQHAHAADHEVIAVAEGVHVVAGAGPDVAELGCETRLLANEIFRGRELHVRRVAFEGHYRQSRPLRERRIIGEIAKTLARRAAVRIEDHVITKRL